MRVRLPWPPSELRPNRGGSWSKKAMARKAYRDRCYLETLIVKPGLEAVPEGPLSLTMRFCPPSRYKVPDADNLVASMKGGIDGMCDALGFDDGRFVESHEYVLEPEREGYVLVDVGRGVKPMTPLID